MKKTSEIIFGIRPVIEAIKNGSNIEKIIVKKDIGSENWRDLYQLIKANRIPFQFVPLEKLNKTTNQNHQGVIAHISKIEYSNIEQIIPFLYENGINPLILILDHITDVRNFGAICRTAECAGVNAIVIPAKGSAQINADAIKSSAGAIMNLEICRENSLVSTIDFLKASGIKVLAATEKAKNDIYSADLKDPLAIIMGSEETGITNDLLKKSDILTKIPIFGKIESLNVSVSAGIILYEALRQRTA